MTARKAGDTVSTAALRGALTAIDNAETPDLAPDIAEGAGVIAGASLGLGSGEVSRRELSDTQIRELLRREIAELLDSAHTIDAHDPQRAGSLHAEAAVLRNLLDSAEVG
jgi:uncharacterized protein